MADATPYSTVRPMIGVLPSWLTANDAERIEAYRVYENMYWGVPNTFALAWRGSEDQPIYVPSAKTIVEACNRYLAVGFDYALQGADAGKVAARLAMDTLFRRERFFAKFTTAKRFGLIRGDSLFHIRADTAKPAGRRISILEVDPASYFPITDDNDPDKIIGVHLVDQWVKDPLKPSEISIRRQTYRKEEGAGGSAVITSELTFWELGGWDDRTGSGQKLKKVTGGVPTVPKYQLPPDITALPVYHIMNQRTPLHPFGSSELKGLERIMAAVNQGISDQELALALAGLGTYVTNAGSPKDEEGNDTDWVMGPGNVVEVSGDKPQIFFDRVDGIKSVTPSIDHLNWLWQRLKEASATPDIATGAVDVAVAASGIALTLQMGPLLAKNAEKEDEILGVADHMFFDILNGWLPAYESLRFDGVDAVPVVGDPMPVDRAAIIKEISDLMATDPPILSAETARTILRDKLGYEFSEAEAVAVVQSAADLAIAKDPFTERLRQSQIDEQGAV